MSQILIVLSFWLHSIATVILIGHYLLLASIYLPALTKSRPENVGGLILSEISKQSRSRLYLSLLIFIITGTYLTVVDPNYRGIGDFGNAWGIFMLIKHLLILVMIAMGFWFNAILRVGPLMGSNTGAIQALTRFRFYVNWMSILGLLVLLLTAFAQMQ